jgi:hypothetical protein
MADHRYHSHESEQPATGIESCMTRDAHRKPDIVRRDRFDFV